MTAQTEAKPTTQSPSGQPDQRVSLTDELAALAGNAQSRYEFIESAFATVSLRLNAFWGLLEQQIDGRTVTRQYSKEDISAEQLADLAYALSVEAQMDSKSRARFVATELGELLIVSCPLVNEGEDATSGAVTWFTKSESRESAQKQAKVFEQVSLLINSWATKVGQRVALQAQTKKAQSASVEPRQVKALLNASKFENITALCYGLANSYCQKLNCQQTAIGLVANNQVKITAVSGIDTIVQNSPAIVQIQQAQEECLDNGKRVVVQQALTESDIQSDGLLIHQRWHQSNAGASVASIPISVDGQKVAVFSLRRNPAQPFTAQELDQIDETIQAFGPAIMLMKKSSRSLRRHLKDSWRENILQRFKSKAFAIASVVALAFFIFGWLPYRPTIPCTIQPAKINHLTAPYDAVVANAPFLAGDKINKGDSIIQFDTRSLELERDSILARINSKTISRNQATVERDKIQAAIIAAEIQADQVELQSVERKIAQGSLKAQYEGTIIRGDMRHQIGQTISQGTPLMEIAPSEGMRIQIEIPEEQASLIKVGYVGSFSAGARPGDRHEFKITKITPSTTIRNGKNVVMGEAEVTGNSEWMRTGMTGFASVKAGWQPVWWMTCHRFMDKLRLGFWL